jgi:MtN3 and saliva related transmembrane protein
MLVQNVFGSIAFVTSVIGLFPQVYKAIKTRSTDDISMFMLLNFLICSLAWIVYGFYTHSFYVEASNLLGLISCLMLLQLKYRYDTRTYPKFD